MIVEATLRDAALKLVEAVEDHALWPGDEFNLPCWCEPPPKLGYRHCESCVKMRDAVNVIRRSAFRVLQSSRATCLLLSEAAEVRMSRALHFVRDLRSKATSIDGWCSSCSQIDKHLDWCPWTQLIGLLDAQQKQSADRG